MKFIMNRYFKKVSGISMMKKCSWIVWNCLFIYKSYEKLFSNYLMKAGLL